MPFKASTYFEQQKPHLFQQEDLLKKYGHVSPTPTLQMAEVSSTEKVHATRLQYLKSINEASSSNNKDSIDEFNKSIDEDIISSTIRESDSCEDNDSGEEYNPKPDQECDSDSSSSDPEDIDLHEHEETYLNAQHNLYNNDKINTSEDKMDETAAALDSPVKVITKKGNLIATKKKRIWNKRDHCYFCYEDVTKFSRHVVRHHQNETKVQEILALKKGDKRRKNLFNKLRNEGNFMKSTCGENIVPIRKPVGNIAQPTQSTYLPCKYCKGFYKKEALYRHVKKCVHNDGPETGRTLAQSEGQSLLSTYKFSDTLRKEVFPKMRADNVSFVAKTDPLICAVAARYLKSHRDKQFYLVASRKMRQLASLLIEIKKKIKVKCLLEALDPTYYDHIVASTKAIARFDSEAETYGAPSLASNMGTQLKECIDVACNMLLKKFRTETESMQNLKALKDLISSEWQYDVSTIANHDLSQKKWNKPSLIPLAEDLTLLRSYLLSEAEKCRNALETNPRDEKAFKILQEICYIQLLLLNRRRAGELQRITLHTYTTHINNDYKSSEFDNCISENEKILMKSFKRIVIKGKRGRGVPVLFTEEMVKNTDILLKNRDQFMKQNNIFLFGNIKSSSCISGTQVMYKHVRVAGVKNAAALTSTKLRKHLATMSQVINLSEQDLEQLAIFMGHTSDIHKTYYRLPNDVYQMAKVSKLLLLNERGEAAKFKGKRLDEIDINLDPIEEEPSEDENEDSEGMAEYSFSSNSNEKINEPSTSNTQMTATDCSVMEKAARGKKRILEPWKETQKKMALSYFKDHLKRKIAPKKNECMMLKEEHAETFSNKSWEKIKIFIVNTYTKM
ncbi:unnamed protein product [Ceutorhynchus assimilis]|uniref:Uncharacterized protein n=1 Tax=Ceutorhynchus assimilis TaxID=467358 RepID=A0A9N9QLI4_9CUCU|nr:unnamed protein product [Ceutorhynchus assimilis]